LYGVGWCVVTDVLEQHTGHTFKKFFLDCLTLQNLKLSYPETSVANNKTTTPNIPEEQRTEKINSAILQLVIEVRFGSVILFFQN
jgi:hypothetical protein